MKAPPLPLWRMTRVRYDRLVDVGIFGPEDRVELLDGVLVVCEPHGERHATVVGLVRAALERRSAVVTTSASEAAAHPVGTRRLEVRLGPSAPASSRRSPRPEPVFASPPCCRDAALARPTVYQGRIAGSYRSIRSLTAINGSMP
jgi:hypothetical protein